MGKLWTPFQVEETPRDRKLSPDDWCFDLREITKAVPNRGLRRIQQVRVPTDNGGFHLFQADLGLAASFPDHVGFIYLIGGEWGDDGKLYCWDKVGNMMLIAEDMRQDKATDETIEYVETTDKEWEEDVTRMLDEQQKQRTKLSTFGPIIEKERV